MASPLPMAQMGNWGGQGQQIQPQQQQQLHQQPISIPPSAEQDDAGAHVRLMGLKVIYTVDRDSQDNYLARHPQLLHVKTIPIDEKNELGVVDLRECAQCIAHCSPELVGQDRDYTVYAYDYSEPDTPLVGQGMLSWILDPNPSEPKIVIGRVTKNLLAAFAGGVKDTLEVKFKLNPTPRMTRLEQRPDFARAGSHVSMDLPQSQNRMQEGAMTPTGAAEWNSFLQSNPQLGHSANISRVASPALSQSRAEFPHPLHNRRDSFSQRPGSSAQMLRPLEQAPGDATNRIAPTPVEAPTEDLNAPSRPSSRASTKSRKKQPTGRPRGRPRKNPVNQPALDNQGSTSGYEDGTDMDEGPAKKKRATTTQVNKNLRDPFGGGSDSLRVAASTSGSIRNLRPAGAGLEAGPGSHLQEVPRAPTPVPEGGSLGAGPIRPANASNLRRQSTLNQAATAAEQHSFQDTNFGMSPPSQDGRSPGESDAATPMYSEDSPAPIGSSPPVPRTSNFMRSSPPASSPILPPMPKPQPDSGFMSGGPDDLYDEPMRAFQLPPPEAAAQSKRKKPRPRDTSNIPIHVWDMRSEQPFSSDVDMLPYNQSFQGHTQPTSTPALPPLNRSRSDSQAMMAPPLPKEREEPSPKLTEQAVTSKEYQGHEEAPAPRDLSTRQLSEDIEQSTSRTDDRALLERLQVATREDSTVSDSAAQPSKPTMTAFQPPRPCELSRSASTSSMPLALPSIPASDPIGPVALPPPAAPETTSFSEAPCPPSDALHPPKSPQSLRMNKNYVKKATIRMRLEQAIASGEMPPFCKNCGAIETPTWRKIWTQDRTGTPEFYEFSEKPGKVTAVIVQERDEEDKITKHQLIKKSLGPQEAKSDWVQCLLCNPCGIWLSKWKSHRPAYKWEKDQTRLQQTRSRRGGGRSRSKRAASQATQASETNLQTDPIGSEMPAASPDDDAGSQSIEQPQPGDRGETRSREASVALDHVMRNGSLPPSRDSRSNPGSTHSRGSGTMQSPIALDQQEDCVADMGATRRLLFPSPRKDSVSKVLGNVAVNVVQTLMAEPRDPKQTKAEKENFAEEAKHAEPTVVDNDDDLEALFRSPIARPSTPPPRERSSDSGAFKTPTRPTPSHRPITRSVSRSVRSARSQTSMPQKTPTRTPRSVARLQVPESPSLRRSPRFTQGEDSGVFDTPMTRSINQLLSEANDFDVDMNGLDFDLSALPPLDGHGHGLIDFGNLLSTDAVMPSSSPKGGRHVSFDYDDVMASTAKWGGNGEGHMDGQ